MKLRTLFMICFMLPSVMVMAQETGAGRQMDVVPKVNVGDTFDYRYVNVRTVNEVNDTTARDYTLKVSEINDTTIVMDLNFTSSKLTNNKKKDNDDAMLESLLNKALGSLTSQSYRVAVDRKSGTFLGIYGGYAIGRKIANEVVDSLVSLSSKMQSPMEMTERDIAPLRASFTQMFCPDHLFEELTWTFFLGFDSFPPADMDEDGRKVKCEQTPDGIEYFCEMKAGDADDSYTCMKLSLGNDNMLRSFSNKERSKSTMYMEDGNCIIQDQSSASTIERVR